MKDIPAFPVVGHVIEDSEPGHMIHGQLHHGMTLRDYFAAKAMQGFCANKDSTNWTAKEMASDAYSIADYMLKARQA